MERCALCNGMTIINRKLGGGESLTLPCPRCKEVSWRGVSEPEEPLAPLEEPEGARRFGPVAQRRSSES